MVYLSGLLGGHVWFLSRNVGLVASLNETVTFHYWRIYGWNSYDIDHMIFTSKLWKDGYGGDNWGWDEWRVWGARQGQNYVELFNNRESSWLSQKSLIIDIGSWARLHVQWCGVSHTCGSCEVNSHGIWFLLAFLIFCLKIHLHSCKTFFHEMTLVVITTNESKNTSLHSKPQSRTSHLKTFPLVSSLVPIR